MVLDPITQKNINLWLEGAYDAETKAEIRRMLEKNPEELTNHFYSNLSFGTGGMRGIMGIGPNCMNQYTVGAATQGLANHLNKQKDGNLSAIISYDSRHNSRFFAEEAAKVLAANGIRVYISKELRPTPWVSFGCRLKGCQAGIMITASHNSAKYNGYKVYGRDGGQVVSPDDASIINEAAQIDSPEKIKLAPDLNHPLITWVDEEIDEPYIYAMQTCQHYAVENKGYGKTLKIVYTSLHGTGITLMPKTLAAWGFPNVTFVESQIIPDGNFPTVKLPNPEEREALTLGIDLMKETSSDVLIATDPDADRVGIAVMHNKEVHMLNGNQVAVLCVAHVCEAMTAQGTMPAKGAFVKSIGTTELFKVIVESYGKSCFNVLTGFKYVAQKIREWEQDPKGYKFIFGAEESYGYLLGTYARDKDALVTSALICEMVLHLKLRGRTLIDYLYSIYERYGYYYEQLFSINFPDSKEGRQQIADGVLKLQTLPPKSIAGHEIAFIEDYQKSIKTNLETGEETPINLAKENMLLFWLKDGSKLVVRPSGTEPKVKLYCGILLQTFTTINEAESICKAKASSLIESLKANFLQPIKT